MIEVFVKLVITTCTLTFLGWLWTSHIDLRNTGRNVWQKIFSPPNDWIATRADNFLYQNGEKAALIVGDVITTEDGFIFKELNDIADFDNFFKNKFVDYKRSKLEVLSASDSYGMFASSSGKTKRGVLLNVACKKIH